MPSEEEIGTTIMVGIKSSKDLAGQRGARHEWIWETWDDFLFRRGSEFWGMLNPHMRKYSSPFVCRMHPSSLGYTAGKPSHISY
jgi:hypothetical protein